MPLHAAYIAEEDRLDLTFAGNLDVSVARELFNICDHASADLKSCIVDLTGVDRVFDSGVGLLQMFCRRLNERGTSVILLTDRPEIKACVARITGEPRNGQPDIVRQVIHAAA